MFARVVENHNATHFKSLFLLSEKVQIWRIKDRGLYYFLAIFRAQKVSILEQYLLLQPKLNLYKKPFRNSYCHFLTLVRVARSFPRTPSFTAPSTPPPKKTPTTKPESYHWLQGKPRKHFQTLEAGAPRGSGRLRSPWSGGAGGRCAAGSRRGSSAGECRPEGGIAESQKASPGLLSPRVGS